MGNSLQPEQEDNIKIKNLEKKSEEAIKKIHSRTDLTNELKKSLIETEEITLRFQIQEILMRRLQGNDVMSRKLNEQLLQKYFQTISLFGIVILCICLIFSLILYFQSITKHDVSIQNHKISLPDSCRVDFSSLPVDGTPINQTNFLSSTSINPMIITSQMLEDLFQALILEDCVDSICHLKNSSDYFLEQFQTITKLPQHQIPYISLLKLLSTHIIPTISFSFIATSLAVIFSTLAAWFSITYFWPIWKHTIRITVSVIYCVGFISLGIYIFRVAKDRSLEIPAGIFVCIGCLFSQVAIPAIYHLITPVINEENGTVSPMLSSSSDNDWWTIVSHDPLMSFLAPLLVTFTASISIYFIPFAPLGSLITIGLNLVLFSLIGLLQLPRVVLNLLISLLEMILWYITLTPHDPTHHAFSITHYLTPSSLSLNPFYPIISYTSMWVEFTAAILCFIYVLITVAPFILVKGSLKNIFGFNVLYAFSLVAIYVGINIQNLSSYLVGHLSILIFSLLSVRMLPIYFCIYNFFLIYISYQIQSQSILLVGPIESLSNIVLGPIGILFYTIFSLSQSGPENDTKLLAFVMNLIMIFISAQSSRSLMLAVGLIGVASNFVWIGFMKLKGQGDFYSALISLLFLVGKYAGRLESYIVNRIQSTSG